MRVLLTQGQQVEWCWKPVGNNSQERLHSISRCHNSPLRVYWKTLQRPLQRRLILWVMVLLNYLKYQYKQKYASVSVEMRTADKNDLHYEMSDVNLQSDQIFSNSSLTWLYIEEFGIHERTEIPPYQILYSVFQVAVMKYLCWSEQRFDTLSLPSSWSMLSEVFQHICNFKQVSK